MAALLTEVGNPSSLHGAGRRARRIVEESRETVAASLGARPSEVVFTSGGTESDNLAIKGLYWSRRAQDARRRRILFQAVEHHAVLDSALWLAEHEGARDRLAAGRRDGRVSVDALAAAVAEDPDSVALVSVMWANNEVGTVQPVAQLAEVAHEHGIPLHTDAVQAVGQLAVDFAASGVDAMTVTGHKFGGPVGAGVLLLGRDVDCDAGAARRRPGARRAFWNAGRAGGRRAGRCGRAGGEGAAGAGGAVARAAGRPRRARAWPRSLRRCSTATRRCRWRAGCPATRTSRSLAARATRCCCCWTRAEIECSTGSACSAGVARPAHVLLAMGMTRRGRAARCGSPSATPRPPPTSTRCVEVIGPAVERARAAGQQRGRR